MRILVVTKNWLGDLLFQLPAVEEIRRRWPKAEIVCLTPSRCAPILQAHPAVDRVLIFDERKEHRPILARLRFLLDLRRAPWDRAYLFHRSRTRAAITLLAGAKERIGYQGRRKWLLSRPIPEPVDRLHHVDYFLRLLENTGHQILGDRKYRFYFSKEDELSADRLRHEHGLEEGRYACFHLGANWEPKRWPVELFARTADLLGEKPGIPVVLTGTQEEASLAEAMKAHVRRARLIFLTGKTSLGVLGSLFQKAAFMLSGDSGPMHIASGAGARVIALFGPTDPALTGPRGTGESIILQYIPEGYQVPWYGTQLPAEGWLSRIRPEEVLAKIEEKGWLSCLGKPVSNGAKE